MALWIKVSSVCLRTSSTNSPALQYPT